MEEWRPTRGYAGYEASTLGRIRSAKTKRVKKLTANKSGYQVVCLRDDAGQQRVVKVHRLVASAFLPEFNIEDPAHEVDHIDRNKANNRPENLRIADRVLQNLNRDHTNAAKGKRYPVEQVNKISGQVVHVHESVNAPARAIGGAPGNICNVLNDKLKSAYGWAWRYVAQDMMLMMLDVSVLLGARRCTRLKTMVKQQCNTCKGKNRPVWF